MGPEYDEHAVFAELQRYGDVYHQLAYSVFGYLPQGTQAIFNIDSYAFSSMEGTLGSIGLVLGAGRINDAFTLLRKYHDSAVINIYARLYLNHHFGREAFIVTHINDWVRGKKKLPRYQTMMAYIQSAKDVQALNELFDQSAGGHYASVRRRCNDHTHSNFYQFVLLNDNKLGIERLAWLDQFSRDLLDLFVFHAAYLFYLSDHYMMSSDYLDALEVGAKPEEDSQYWVAPYVQATFDDIITPARPEVTAAVKANSMMELR